MNGTSFRPQPNGLDTGHRLGPDAQRCLSELAQSIGFNAEVAHACAEMGILVLGSVSVRFSAKDVDEDSSWMLIVQDHPEVQAVSLTASTLERVMRINGVVASLQSAAIGLDENETLELVLHSKMMPRDANLLTLTLSSALLLWQQCIAQAELESEPQTPHGTQAQSLESLQADIAKLDDLSPQETAVLSNTLLLAGGIDIASTDKLPLDAALSQKLWPFLIAQGVTLAAAQKMAQSGQMQVNGISLTVLADGVGEACIFIADLKHADTDIDIQYLKSALSVSSMLMKTCQASVVRWSDSTGIALRCSWPLLSASRLAGILDHLQKLAMTLGGAFSAPSLLHSH